MMKIQEILIGQASISLSSLSIWAAELHIHNFLQNSSLSIKHDWY